MELQQNPADEASRRMKARATRFPMAPWMKENEWSKSDKVDHSLDIRPDDPEVKRSSVMATGTMETYYPDIAERIERFSDWFRAKRAVANCVKYVKRLKNRVNNTKEKTCEVSVDDLEAAEAPLFVRSKQVHSKTRLTH